MASGVPSETAKAQAQSTPTLPDFQNLGIESSDIKIASGVELSQHQKLIVGSVLDLFAGKPSLKKLGLWTDDAVFQDNITKAEGRKRFEPQWYGLQTAFSEIHREHFEVKKGGNPIEMELKTRYKIKGLGKEQTIASLVKIHTAGEGENMRIKEVQDRWNSDLPDGPFAKVSFLSGFYNPWWWYERVEGWVWWAWWGVVLGTRPWEAFRNLNSVVVPAFVSVPKNEEEDAKRGN